MSPSFCQGMRHARCGASLWPFAFWYIAHENDFTRRRLDGERVLLNCERFGRRYAARSDGLLATKSWRKCAHSNRVAASAVSVSALRRELPRSHKHRVCDARDERRPGFKRFSVWHSERNFFYWIFCSANSRGVVGGALERRSSPRDNADA